MLKGRKRIQKKELKQDKLLETLYNIEMYVKDNSQRLFIVGVLVVAVLVVSFVYFSSKSQAEYKAAGEVGKAQFILLSGDFNDAIVRLEDVLRKYPGTRASGEGTYYLANAYYSLGNKDDAKKYYRKYIDEYSGDVLLRASAQAGLGACYEDMGDYTSAAEMYARAARDAETNYQYETYTINAVRNYMIAENPEKAKNLLDAFVTSDKLSPDARQKAETWLVVAESRLGSAEGSMQ